MFTTLRSRILLLIFSLFALTAALIMLSTDRQVGRAMLMAEERAASNVIWLTESNLRGEYRNFLSYKIETAVGMKSLLKSRAELARRGVAVFQNLARQGALSEDEARRQALEWLGAMADGVQESLLVYDRSLAPLCVTDACLTPAALSELRDIKGRSLAATMLQTTAAHGDGFSIYYVPPTRPRDLAKRLGCFSYDRQWGWVIAISLDVAEAETAAQRKLEAVLDSLRLSLAEIRIAQTGYVFLFNGDSEILVHPGRAAGADDPAQARNQLTGRPLLADLIEAAKEGRQTPLRYQVQDVDGRVRLKEACVTRVKALDWYAASSVYVDEIEAPAKSLVRSQLGITSAIFAAALAVSLVLIGRISGPLRRLAGQVKEIAAQDFTAPRAEASPLADLERRSDEVGRLALAFDFMQDELRRNIRDTLRMAAENERIESELKIAHNIQMSLLPKTFPPFPDRRELDVFAAIAPAREVGGDLYDFFFVDDRRLCFVIGDVSGKGVPAAFFMAVTKTLITAVTTPDRTAEEIMAKVNDALCQGNESSMFVTLFLGLFDVVTGEVEFTNGGHNPPAVLGAGAASFARDRHGPLVGALEGVPYGSSRLVLAPGQAIFLYTDGVTEAMNAAEELFGEERLLASLTRLAGQEPKDVVAGVLADVALFVGDAPQSDDIAMLALRRQHS